MLSSDACLEIFPQDDRESQSVVCEDQESVHFDNMSLSREHALAENEVRESCAPRGSTTSSIENSAPLDQEPDHVNKASSQRVEESSSLQQVFIPACVRWSRAPRPVVVPALCGLFAACLGKMEWKAVMKLRR